VALYGSETWSVKKADTARLEAFEMWVSRRMEKVKWMDKKTNVEVFNLVNDKKLLS